MHVIRNTEEIRKFIGEKKTAVALGAFDGLHIGHYKVIRTAVESGLTPVVFTFRDNPAEYLTGTCCYLTTVEERMRILESWGVCHHAGFCTGRRVARGALCKPSALRFEREAHCLWRGFPLR